MCDISNSCLVKDNKDRMSQCPEQALPHCPTWVFPSLLHCKIILFTCKMDFFFPGMFKILKENIFGIDLKDVHTASLFLFPSNPFLIHSLQNVLAALSLSIQYLFSRRAGKYHIGEHWILFLKIC